MIPHKGHRVTQWNHSRHAGWDSTEWYCWDCDETCRISMSTPMKSKLRDHQ